MALKFLNKKGWHTGSLRNIENVWKAEQKHDAEQKKLEELRKQIQEEREKSEFRLLQEQAGLVPRQERLDFLYDSGLACGKGNSDGFKALESYPKTEAAEAAPASSSKQQSATPGALFEEKPQSANDAWRKLHSDPLLLIRQREQEALARIKNNPVQMANIRKSVEEKKKSKVKSGKKKKHEKRDRKNVKHENGHSSEEDYDSEKEDGKKRSHRRDRSDSENEERRKRKDDRYLSSKGEWLEGDDASDGEERKRRSHHSRSYVKDSSSKGNKLGDDNVSEGDERKERSRHSDRRRHDHYSSNGRSDSETEDRRKRDYNRYSSSKGEVSGKDAERNQRSRHQDDKKLDRYPLNGKSGLESEEKSREKSKHERYSTQMAEAPKRNSERSYQRRPDSETEERRKEDYNRYSSSKSGISGKDAERNQSSRHQDDRKLERYPLNGKSGPEGEEKSWEKSKHERHSTQVSEVPETNLGRSHPRQRRPVTKLSEEEKAARLREMEMDALVHEEQRWKRLKKASEKDAQEANISSSLGGQNFLSAAQKSVYGAEKGGSSTIEESVRRRKYYSQGRSESNEGNAFRR